MDPITLSMAKKHANKKGGYTTTKNVEIVPNAKYEFYNGELALPATCIIKGGDEIITTIDGIEYRATAKEVDGGGVLAGNGMVFGAEDNGDPYCTVIATTDAGYMAIVAILAEVGTEETTQHTVSVDANLEFVHFIDGKYIPRTVVDLSDVLSSYENDTGEDDIHIIGEDRVAAFVKGVQEENLVIAYNGQSGEAVVKEKFIPVSYGILRNEDENATQYSVSVGIGGMFHSFTLTRFSDESHSFYMT